MNGLPQPIPSQQSMQTLPDFLSKEEVDLLKRTLLKSFTEDEQMTFVRICQRTHLDPFTKQIYATRRYQKVKDDYSGETRKVATLVPVTGIMGLTAVADRTQSYDGCELFWSGPDGVWKTEWLADEPPAAAKCIVYHKHRGRPETAIARWLSYAGQSYNYQTKQWELSDFWSKMPDYMLAKCAKASALRGAFPSPLSNVYIREELESNITDSETEDIPSDEEKIALNQRREAEMRKEPPAGVKIVESKPGPKPTPQEALEPAFAEDKIPEKPKEPSKKAKDITKEFVKEYKLDQPKIEAKAEPSEPKVESLDELDMSPAPEPAAAPQESATPWKEHVITGVNHVRFSKRKVGDLNAMELGILETQWLPAVRSQWNDATDAQRADAAAFEAAIAFSKMAKPW